jgi:muramoyltetrapeptide carboxypeptidase
METRRPRALVPGDRVAVVAPASRYDGAALARGAAVLESWGLAVDLPPHSRPHRYFAAPDEERAAQLTEAFERDDVAAVMAVRGGFGASRLLGLFDPAVAARHPKIFLGYSDLTVLLGRLQNEAGLVCFHGPMVSSDLARLPAPALEPFRRFLFGEDGWWRGEGLTSHAAGVAEGAFTGGCLSMLATTIGTPYEFEARGRVLFLEDIAEPPYRIDRLLTHLLHAGKFEGVSAVVLGTFTDCDPKDEPGLTLSIAEEILGGLGVPVVSGFDAGHFSGGGLVPMGARVRVDAGAGRIDLLEPVLAQAAGSRAA